MHYELLYPSKYVKGSDLKGVAVTLKIEAVGIQTLEKWDKTLQRNVDEQKGVVAFVGAKKAWVLNRTNGESLKLMFGPKTEDWIGKRVTLHTQKVKNEFTGEMVDAIRVLGSPDITEKKEASLQRGRKKISVTVIPTTAAAKEQKIDDEPGATG